MALDDNAVTLPGRGYVFFHPTPGTATPLTTATVGAANLDAATLATGWRNWGHTSRENAVQLRRDVTEGEVKGTWQKPNLRETPDEVRWGWGIGSLQMSNDVFDAYFGVGDKSDEDVFHVAKTNTVLEGALLIVLVDGAIRVPFYNPKVSIKGDGEPEFGVEDFTEFPIRATVLDHSAAEQLMSIYRAGLGTPS